jgi:hypothetical protein
MQFEDGDIQVVQRGESHFGAGGKRMSVRDQLGVNLVVVHAQVRLIGGPAVHGDQGE